MTRVCVLALVVSLAGIAACGHGEAAHEPLLTDYASPSERYVADVQPADEREQQPTISAAVDDSALAATPATDAPSDDAFAAAMERELTREPIEPVEPSEAVTAAAPESTPPAQSSEPAPAVVDSRPATLEVRTRGKARGVCRVVVGTQTIGKLPRAQTTVTPGEHRVEVRCNDRRRFVETLLLAPGDAAKLVVAPSDLKREKKAPKRARR